MPDYQRLYHLMVNAAEDALAALAAQNYGTAADILTAAEQKAEELYLAEEPEV